MNPDRWLHILRLRLRSIFRRSAAEKELDEELRYHLDMRTEENLATGMSGKEAGRAALIALGGLEQRKEQCRDMRGMGRLEDVWRDISYSLRRLRRSPAFAAGHSAVERPHLRGLG